LPTHRTNNLFTVPASAANADRLAADLGALADATGWKLAALIYARVRVQQHRGRPSSSEKINLDLLTPAQFADLGIRGLRGAATVRAYWRAWNVAIIQGLAVPVGLGDEVSLPTADFTDFYFPLAAGDESHSQPDREPVPDPLEGSAGSRKDSCTCATQPRPRLGLVLDKFYGATSGIADNALALVNLMNSKAVVDNHTAREALRVEHGDYLRWAADVLERALKQVDDVLNEMC
jgi:hypothetical protein